MFKKDTAVEISEAGAWVFNAIRAELWPLPKRYSLSYEDLPTFKDNVDELIAHVTSNNAQMQKEAPHIWLAHAVYERMIKKLGREPVEFSHRF